MKSDLTNVELTDYIWSIQNGWAKVEIGLAKGKHHYDKKETAKKRDIQRETEREVRKY